MGYKYAFQGDKEQVAAAVSTNVHCSTKQAVMIANFVRGKTVKRAIRDLTEVINKSMAVPFTRFTEGAGHKPGIGPGKYPQKATKAFLQVIRSAAANAEDKGFDSDLKIISCTANQGVKSMRYGRHRGRQRKSTHIEVIVTPVKKEKEKTNGN